MCAETLSAFVHLKHVCTPAWRATHGNRTATERDNCCISLVINKRCLHGWLAATGACGVCCGSGAALLPGAIACVEDA